MRLADFFGLTCCGRRVYRSLPGAEDRAIVAAGMVLVSITADGQRRANVIELAPNFVAVLGELGRRSAFRISQTSAGQRVHKIGHPAVDRMRSEFDGAALVRVDDRLVGRINRTDRDLRLHH